MSVPHDAPPDRPFARAPLLRVRDLRVTFPVDRRTRALGVDGVCLDLHPARTFGLVGESACGKSVTALSILRLLRAPPSRIDGRIELRRGAGTIDLLTLPEREMRRVRGGEIAMIFQEPMTSLNPVLSIGDQLREAIAIHQPEARRRTRTAAIRALEAVGIQDAASRLRAWPHEFSGGMRQRVMIAMALACSPRILIADEPTTALDVTVQARILDLLRELRRSRGLSMLFISHDLAVVASIAHEVGVMYAGRIVERAPPARLFARPLHPYTRALLSCAPVPGRRRDRLRSVGELTRDEERFASIPGLDTSRRAWWPWHDPPGGPPPDHADDSELLPVAPDHAVRVWRARAPGG